MEHAPNVGIVITGAEITEGRIVDTNSSFIASELTPHGIRVRTIITVDDHIEHLEDAIRTAASRCDAVIVSGGLGPTTDDCTREAIARCVGAPLKTDDLLLEDIKAFFASRNRPFVSINERQAAIPVGSRILRNARGSAPGFIAAYRDDKRSVALIALPGVPHELRAMFKEQVLPMLINELRPTRRSFAMLKSFGLTESMIGERVEALALPASLEVSYRAAFPEIHVLVKGSHEDVATAQSKIKEVLGKDYLFSEEWEGGFPDAVHAMLLEKGKTLAVAESCTGGLLGSIITSFPGSSRYFLGGVISYSNQLKEEQLAVPKELLKAHGAVSAPVAEAMARGARDGFLSSLAVSITGVAGPDGGSEEKPVGTFFIGVADGRHTHARRFFFPGDRDRVRRYACWCALAAVRRVVLGEQPFLPPKP